MREYVIGKLIFLEFLFSGVLGKGLLRRVLNVLFIWDFKLIWLKNRFDKILENNKERTCDENIESVNEG